MQDFKRIVFATDFSDASKQALDFALRIARHHEAELHILHVKVAPHPGYITFGSPDLIAEIETAQDLYADELLEELVPDAYPGKVILATERNIGAAKGVSDYADSHDCDLIVIGSHGYSGFEKMILGSETLKVLRLANVPLLIVKTGIDSEPGDGAPFRRLLAPVDLSPAAQAMLRQADMLAERYGAELVVMHSLDVVTPAPYSFMPPVVKLPQARQELGGFVAAAALRTKPKEIVVEAPAAQGIVDTATSLAVDLIVISRTGLSGWRRFWVGSVTERVLNVTTCPVLVLPTTG